MAVNATAPQNVAPEGTESAQPNSEQNVQVQPAVTPASPQPTEQDQTRGNDDWFRQAFSAQRGVHTTGRDESAPAPQPETPPASTDPRPEPETQAARPAPAGERQPSQSQSRTSKAFSPPKSQEEFDRAVQAEADRRLDKHNREEAARRQAAQAQQQALAERELRQKDPYQYAQLMEQREQENAALQQQLQVAQRHVLALGNDFDRNVLDPLVLAVPAAERARILENVPDGVQGRSHVARSAMQVLEKHWRSQGEADARKRLINDQSFVKEVMARYGGQRPEPESTPAVSGAVVTGGSEDAVMNNWLRGSRR